MTEPAPDRTGRPGWTGSGHAAPGRETGLKWRASLQGVVASSNVTLGSRRRRRRQQTSEWSGFPAKDESTACFWPTAKQQVNPSHPSTMTQRLRQQKIWIVTMFLQFKKQKTTTIQSCPDTVISLFDMIPIFQPRISANINVISAHYK